MILWFTDLMNVTEEVTIYRPNVSTLLSSAFIRGAEAECLLSHLNSVESSIQFTLEREKDRHLPFLDLNVSRGVQGNLETSVYRKPTHTNKYLAFSLPYLP